MQEQRFLLITGILIALLGVPSVMSVVREPIESASALSGVSAVGRSPASTAILASHVQTKAKVVHSPRNAIHSRSVVMNYDCNQTGNMEVDGTLLRLKGQDSTCLSDKWTNISITNHSNGFTASVIFLKKGFTTDFIDLKEGDNNLEIQAKDDKGQAITKKITVKRRSIASVEDASK